MPRSRWILGSAGPIDAMSYASMNWTAQRITRIVLWLARRAPAPNFGIPLTLASAPSINTIHDGLRPNVLRA
jgi:hypothetical protein